MPEAGISYECVKIKRYWGEGETKIPDSVTEIGKEAFVFCAGHFDPQRSEFVCHTVCPQEEYSPQGSET